MRAFAEIVAGVYERRAGLLAVAATAAEADEALAALQARSYRRRLRDCTAVVNRLHDDSWLDPAFTMNEAADTVYALSSPEVYLVLRKQRRLPHSRYAGWLAGTLAAALRTAD
ncbi:MAG: hypothetical protein ACR2KP_19755 [Egibacteraceae bacterium]